MNQFLKGDEMRYYQKHLSAVDIILKEPHMLLMVQMEFVTAVEVKPMTPESWNVALETFFNPSAHASFKNTMHLFFILERTLFGE